MIGTTRARLLDLDPDLGSALGPEAFELARHRLIVTTHRIAGPRWRPDCGPREPGHLGYLLIGGMIAREMTVGQGRGVELLTPGDLLRPSQEDTASFANATWRILTTIDLAELDPQLAGRLVGLPQVMDALLGRVMQRSRSQAVYAAIGSVRGLNEKALAVFWHLAERYGVMGKEGVTVPIPLTHQILADLLGARRPSVSLALKDLAAEGLVLRTSEGWLLAGGLPPSLCRPIPRAPISPRPMARQSTDADEGRLSGLAEE